MNKPYIHVYVTEQSRQDGVCASGLGKKWPTIHCKCKRKQTKIKDRQKVSFKKKNLYLFKNPQWVLVKKITLWNL